MFFIWYSIYGQSFSVIPFVLLKISKKVNPMKYLVQSYILLRTGKLYSYILLVYPLDHEIYTKCKKTSNLIKVMSSHNIRCGIKSQQVKKHFSFSTENFTKTFWFFSEFLCTISSSHFWPFNFMCTFNRWTKWKLPKLKKIWKKCHI